MEMLSLRGEGLQRKPWKPRRRRKQRLRLSQAQRRKPLQSPRRLQRPSPRVQKPVRKAQQKRKVKPALRLRRKHNEAVLKGKSQQRPRRSSRILWGLSRSRSQPPLRRRGRVSRPQSLRTPSPGNAPARALQGETLQMRRTNGPSQSGWRLGMRTSNTAGT